MKLAANEKKRFSIIQAFLIQWYKKNRRKFSWRKKIRHPYEVLVCEVMGQQTQASRIEQFLPKFLNKFPSIESLAKAKKSEIIKEWQGLGYNRRALNLQRTAIELSINHSKSFPQTEKELLALPGIGPYTARAILIFAFNKPIATVDVNVQRLLSRLYKKMEGTNSMLPGKDILSLAQSILPKKNFRLWHEALMDFGATICTKRNPACNTCPLFDHCKSGKGFLKNIQIKTKNNLPFEMKYFGQPKRIWRGKVLKIISMNEKIPETSIMSLVTHEKDSEFDSFIRSVLDELIKEGFCARNRNNIYTLA
jgi:A/G-specific adenine glycosylase